LLDLVLGVYPRICRVSLSTSKNKEVLGGDFGVTVHMTPSTCSLACRTRLGEDLGQGEPL
jgi:hypothetical protein